MRLNEGHAYPALETLHSVHTGRCKYLYKTAKLSVQQRSCQSGIVAAPAVAPVELGGSPVCAKMIWTLEIKS